MEVKKLRPEQYLVKDRYVVDLEEESCTCPDYSYRKVRCKHIQYVERKNKERKNSYGKDADD